MNPVLVVIALAIIGGAVVVVSARDARVVVVAATVVMLLAGVLADPMPAPESVAARAVGAILAGYLLWIAARLRPGTASPTVTTGGSRIGWPAELLVGAAAAVAGLAAHGLGAAAAGPAVASATGFAVAALATAPILTGRDVFRLGIGSLLLLLAGLLIRTALGGTPDRLEQILTTGLVIGLAAAIAAMGLAARRDGDAGFAVADDPPRPRAPRPGRPPDAHPMLRPTVDADVADLAPVPATADSGLPDEPASP